MKISRRWAAAFAASLLLLTGGAAVRDGGNWFHPVPGVGGAA
jgi:hypothetical protein